MMQVHPQNRPLFARWEFWVEDTHQNNLKVDSFSIPENAIRRKDELNRRHGSDRYKVTPYSFSRS